MYTYTTQIRVRYAETDQMGYVYYGQYPTYYEVGRVETFRKLGLPYADLEKMGIVMPVIEMSSRYLLPVLYDDLISIKTIIKKLPSVKITFHYEIQNQKGKILNVGETTLIFLDREKQKPLRVPTPFLDLLLPYFK